MTFRWSSGERQRAYRDHRLLPLASLAVAFAAADTYVVVLCLPDMMASVGLSIDQLQRAAPILSGFLLGYVAMLPLIGRIADVRGRPPVLIGSLVLFGFGSLVTAAAYDLPSLVAGRFLQGVGGGGLVPVTLALVADLYPADRRSVPLGIVGAVQELGSVVGPLYGAAILAISDWRWIFWINLAVAGVLALLARGRPARSGVRRRPDLLGLLLVAAFLAGLLLVMRQPTRLTTSVTWGAPFVPFGNAEPTGWHLWWSPIGIGVVIIALALAAWVASGSDRRRRLVDVSAWRAALKEADLGGALLLAVVLGGIILTFATADPQVQVISAAGPWLLAVSAVALGLLVRHLRRARHPLIPGDALRARPAWASLVTSFFIGSALIAVLTDVPIFARATVYADSQTKAALVLVEFLVALPIGAVIGGLLCRRLANGVVAAAGMVLAAAGIWSMSLWGATSLHHLTSSVSLAAAGLGFGLALAPVNNALLAHTPAAVHGVSSALLVVARMVGMLVGISGLTTLGLRRYYAASDRIPSPHEVCGGLSTRCSAYTDQLRDAALQQLHVVFVGAALCALVAAVVALLGLRHVPDPDVEDAS
jgi:MFS family permease